jgi:O-Antigen ligase
MAKLAAPGLQFAGSRLIGPEAYASAGRAGGQGVREERAPLLAAVVVIAVFIPEAFGFLAFGLRLTPARLVLLALSPYMLFSFGSLLGSHRYRFVLSDLLMPATLVWMIVALTKTEGLAAALKSGGVSGLELVGCYLMMRGALATGGQIHAVVRLFCIVAAIAGCLGLLDTLSGYHILRDQIAKLTGYSYYHETLGGADDMYRLGLYRAEGVFEHPILFGVVMAYALILAGNLRGRIKLLCRLGCGLGLFLSLSSAPWMGFMVGIALWIFLGWAPFPYRWSFLIAAGSLLGAVFFMAMPNPFGWIFSHFTLDTESGYFRLLIWQYAGFDVMKSPIVGIGLKDWFRPDWMPASVDSLWLATAMVYGIPGSVLTALAVIAAGSLPVARKVSNAAIIGVRETRLADALGIAAFLTVFLGFTVDYWGASFMIVGLLAGIRAALGQLAHQ